MEIILSLISYNFYFSKKLQNLTNSTSTLCFLRDPIMQQSTRYKSTYSLTNQKGHSIWLLLQPFFAPLQHFELAKSDLPLLKGLTFWANVLWTKMITNHFSRHHEITYKALL